MKLTCIIDNHGGKPELVVEHGLCFAIETPAGAILWDTGDSYAALSHNLTELGFTDTPFQAIGLSHAHGDHTGGLFEYLRHHLGMPVYGLSALLRSRFSLREGHMTPIGFREDVTELHDLADLRLSDEPVEIIEGVCTTGIIAPRPYPMGSSTRHYAEIDGQIVQDDYADDMSLVLKLDGSIALLCGCCHAGLRNTLATVRRQYSEPLTAIIGGTHLLVASSEELEAIVETLVAEDGPDIYLNHCTGDVAITFLRERLGERVHDCPSGTVLEL